MTFTIFKKTGELRDSQGDWDGDEGCIEKIEVDDAEVEQALARIIVDCYVREGISENEHKRSENLIRRLVSDNDLLDVLCENYVDELNDWAQEEYGSE